MTHRFVRLHRLVAVGFALGMSAMPVAAQREVSRSEAEDQGAREAYRRGYDEGYAQGYRKGLEEGRPVIAPPPPPPPRHTIMVNRATYGGGGRRCDASRAVANIANGPGAVSGQAQKHL